LPAESKAAWRFASLASRRTPRRWRVGNAGEPSKSARALAPGFKRPEPFIPKSIGHHAEWIHAYKTGEPTTCNFQYAGWLTEADHLGNVAYRTGQQLEMWN
jgi:hypothetical protein